MPAVATAAAVAIKTVVGTVLTTVGVGATTAYGIGSAVGTALTSGSMLLSLGVAAWSALTPQVDSGGSPTEWRSDPDAPIPFVIGETASAGYIVHRDEWGSDNRYQSIVTVYSGAGPIHAFGTYTADEAPLTFAGAYGRQSTGTWKDIFWRDTKLGNQPETALQTPEQKGDPTIAGSMPEWTSDYKLSGKACDMVTLAMDKNRERWPTGEPKPLQVIQGLLVWDPREDDSYPGGAGDCRIDDPTTWVYSENPYLHALKWCLGYWENGVLVGGIGASQSGIDVAAFVEGANVADANGWVVSGRPTTADDKHQVLQAMLQAGGGRYARKGGKISCLVRTPRTSVVTISAADTAGPFALDINSDRLDRLNTVTPRCVQAALKWEMHPLPPVTSASYVAADGGVRADSFDYPYVALKADNSNQHQPVQLAAYDLIDSREPIRGTVSLKPYMAQIEPGDVFTIDEPGFLLDGVEFLCIKRSFDPAQDIVRISFVSETAGKHDYALGLDPTPPTPPSLTAPDIYTQTAPGVSAWDAVASTGDNPAVVVTGETDDETVRTVRVEVRPYLDPSDGDPWDDDDSGWRVVGEYQPATTQIDITGLESSTQYQAAVSYVSQFGVLGERRILATVTTGELVATRAVGSVTQDDIDSALEFLASANPELAAGLSTLTQVGALNRVFDPLFKLGVRDNVSNTAPLYLVSGDPSALAAEYAVGTGDELDIVFRPRIELRPGSRLMVGAEITLDGPLSAASCQVRFFDADLVEVGTPVTVASATTGNRAEGFLEPADIPADTRWGQLEIVSTATAAGTARLQVHEPFAAYAGPNQSTVEAFRDPQDEVVGRIIANALVEQSRVLQIEGLAYETAVSRAAVLVLQEVTANVARYQIVTTYERDGVSYSVLDLYAANGTSRALLAAEVVMLANLGAGSDEIHPVLIAEGGNAFFPRPIHIDDAAETPTARTIVGPLSDGMVLWSGSPSEDSASASLANAKLAITEDGLFLASEATTNTSDVTVNSGDWKVLVAHSLSTAAAALNAYSFAGTSLTAAAPTGSTNGQATFDWAIVFGTGTAPAAGDTYSDDSFIWRSNSEMYVDDSGTLTADDRFFVQVTKEAGLDPETSGTEGRVAQYAPTIGTRSVQAGTTYFALIMRQRSGVSNAFVADSATLRINKIHNHAVPA